MCPSSFIFSLTASSTTVDVSVSSVNGNLNPGGASTRGQDRCSFNFTKFVLISSAQQKNFFVDVIAYSGAEPNTIDFLNCMWFQQF